MENEKIKSLANYLECKEDEVDEIQVSSYDENLFEYGNQEYLVLTDEEADERAKEDIKESLWAFNTNFILNHTNIDWNDRTEAAIKKMQEELCESANEIIKAMISDIDEFVEDAISADGRGHFLNRYDGNEEEEGKFYIYRTN